MTQSIPEGAMIEFVTECEEILHRVGSIFTHAEHRKISDSEIDSLYRDIHTLKGSAFLFGLKRIGIITHAIEAYLGLVREKKTTLDKDVLDHIFKALDFVESILKAPQLDLDNDTELDYKFHVLLPKLVSACLVKFRAEFDVGHGQFPVENISRENLVEHEKIQSKRESTAKNKVHEKIVTPQQEIEEPIINTPSPVKAKKEVVLESSAELPQKVIPPKMEIKKVETIEANKNEVEKIDTEKSSASQEASTVRVHVGLLDKLMNLVGEMVLTRNQVLEFAKTSENNDFLNLTQRLDLVTSELQDNVMKTRMQPIGSIFTKFQRVVRELGSSLGKKIELRIEGAETELDKSLLEAIKDPLTHIIRNSCDHGIESPADRQKVGKDATGVLILRAYHEGGYVIIEIKDNGKGLDPKRILAKAIEKKIVTQEDAKNLSDSEIQQFIFAPGFSTAEHVTNVSGRGVGMDVVRTNIEKVGGTIDLKSIFGEGTTLKLKIPLTLAIVPAVIIRSESEHFAIPLVKLQELIRIDLNENPNAIESIQSNLFYRLRGSLISLVDLSTMLKPNNKEEKRKLYYIVILKNENYTYGLIVDEISNTADIVVKPLPQFFKRVDVFSGATIMGDGEVALILDVQGIANRSSSNHGAMTTKQVIEDAQKSKTLSSEITDYLYFKLNREGIFSVPLVLVQRLEEFSSRDIESSGTERMVKYRGSLLPLIFLNNYLGFTKQDNSQSDDSKIPVVVVSKRDRLFGLVVDQILDVLSSDSELIPHLKEVKGFLGTILSQERKVVTVVDALRIIDDSIGHVTEKKEIAKFKNVKILFAEDTAFFAKQVKRLIESQGIEVDHALDGQIALEKLLKQGPGYYDLVLSDIEMPNMTGFEFVQTVRGLEEFKKTPMIALTTRFNEADQKKGKELGFNLYLEKLKQDELIDSIKSLLGDR